MDPESQINQASAVNRKEISFIIPALNEEAHINGVLNSIKKHAEGRFIYEVIVIDNGSRDRTVEIVEKQGAICLHAPGCTISTLRNLGVLQAKYDIFVFLDADVYLGMDWGERMTLVMENLHSQPDIITGSLYGVSDKPSWIERVWFAPRTALLELNYINSGHLIIHRSLFSRVGGFDPGLETGEDYDFCRRARMLGARIKNDPDLRVVHAGYPKSIKSFFARERWHARGDYKSISTLASSKPALVSVGNLCMAAACTAGLVVSPLPWLTFPSVYLFFLTTVSLAAAVHRNRGNLNVGVFGTLFLYMVYFTARTVSIVDIVIHPSAEKRPVRGMQSALSCK